MSPLRELRSQSLYTNFLQLGSHLLKGPSIDSMSLPGWMGWAGGITWIQSTAEAGSLFSSSILNGTVLEIASHCLCVQLSFAGTLIALVWNLPSLSFSTGLWSTHRACRDPEAACPKSLDLLQGSCFTPLCFQVSPSSLLSCRKLTFLNQFLPLLLLD